MRPRIAIVRSVAISRSHLVVRFFAVAAVGLAAAHVLGRAQPQALAPRPRRAWRATVMEIVDRISSDNLSLVAAGVAFYAFLALFPAAAALVAVYGLVADPRAVEGQVAELAGLVPPAALDLMLGVVKGVAEKPRGQLGLAFGVSTALALWSARAGVASLMTGLDIAYRVRDLRSFLAQTLAGLALTLGGVFAAALLVALVAGLPAFYAAAPGFFTHAVGPWVGWMRWPLVALEMALSLSILYRFAPSQPLRRWRLLSPGALLATAAWLAASCAFSLYVTWSGSYDATYGSLAGVVVTMLWLWASSLAALAGATVDAVLEDA